MRTDTDVNSKVQNSCNKYEFFTALFSADVTLSLSFKLRDGKS